PAHPLAGLSRHPAAGAVAVLGAEDVEVEDFREVPGYGIEGRVNGSVYRLGRKEWVSGNIAGESNEPSAWLSKNGQAVGSCSIADEMRPGARVAVRELTELGLPAEILSGDVAEEVSRVAATLGITNVHHRANPEAKVERLKKLRAAGRRVLMVGDGL